MSLVVGFALFFLMTIPEGFVKGQQAWNSRCQCITKESRRIGRYLGKVEVYPPSSHCRVTEIIATLKNGGQRVCLDHDALWVSRFLSRHQKSKHYRPSTSG